MTQNLKTLVLVLAALVAVLLAIVLAPRTSDPDALKGEGDKFFEDFSPEEIVSVEIIRFDDQQAQTVSFKVEVDPDTGQWMLPSHDRYPADVTDQIVKVANLFVGVRKESLRSDLKRDQAACNVIDPLNVEIDQDTDDCGRRIILKTARDEFDLIVGKAVEGRGNEGYHYVREPDSRRIYTAKIDADALTTEFSRWVETDLLDIYRYDVKQVEIDHYKVDEVRQTVVAGETVSILRDADDNWTVGGDIPEGKQVDQEKVDQVFDALQSITLKDVHTLDMRDLVTFGFFPIPGDDGGMAIYSNEGETRVVMKDGTVYSLRFGEVTGDASTNDEPAKDGGADDQTGPGSDDEPNAENDDASGDENAGSDSDAPESLNRYLLILVEFDPSVVKPPAEPAKPEMPRPAPEAEDEGDQASDEDRGEDDADAAAGDAGESADETDGAGDADNAAEDDAAESDGASEREKALEAWAAYDRAYERYQEDLAEHERKLEETSREAMKVSRRLTRWFYVISGETFDKLKLHREAFLKDKEPEETPDTDTNGDTGGPADGNPLNLPPID